MITTRDTGFEIAQPSLNRRYAVHLRLLSIEAIFFMFWRHMHKGSYRTLAASVAAFLFSLPLLAFAAPTAKEQKDFRILHIMSYHSPWRWTDRQFESFQEELKNQKIVYSVFQLDTKRNSMPAHKERSGQDARALIRDWQPDLVYTSDDDAQEYVTKHYINTALPFVFSGVNNDPAIYGFSGSKNITGVIEHEHFVETVKLIRKIVPGATKIALVFDDAGMWDPVRRRITTDMSQLPDIKIVASDTIKTFADYKNKIKEYQDTADVVGTIGIFNLKGEDGKNVPYQEVQKWTVENSRLPDFSFWIDRVYYGTLAAVTVSEREQGRSAGRIARSILVEGKSPESIPMRPTTKGMPVVSLARAKKLGIRLTADVLLTTEVIQRFEWEQP